MTKEQAEKWLVDNDFYSEYDKPSSESHLAEAAISVDDEHVEIVMKLSAEIASLRQTKSHMSDVIDQKSAQIKERDKALIDFVWAIIWVRQHIRDTYSYPEDSHAYRRATEFLDKHQSLINQIKESGK